MRLLFGILRILPWWGYMLLAGLLAMATAGVYDDYTRAQANADMARAAGVPPVIPLERYDPNRSPTPIGEARVSGVLRVDLGVNQTGDGTTARTYVILDSESGRGPLMALLMARSEAERGLEQLMADAGADGRVVVTGFHRTADRAAISGQMRLRGETRDIVLLAPYFGNREAELESKANTDWPFLLVFAGLTALAFLFGLYRFRRWRKRSAGRRVRQTRPKGPVSPWDGAERMATRPAKPASDYAVSAEGRVMEMGAIKRPSVATPAGPWGGKPSARPVPPASPETRAQTQPEPPAEVAAPVFKTPDEIILATFGRITRTGGGDKSGAD